MANNDQDLLGFVTDVIERHFDHAGVVLRETISSQTWLPDYARPAPPKPPTPRYVPQIAVPRGLYGSVRRWVLDHRVWTAAMIAFVGTGGYLLFQRRKLYKRKQRAQRTATGARKEVVVVAGVPNSPITRSVILDLERRGFIVYVVASSANEEQLVSSERKPDIMPLLLNISDPSDAQHTIEQFNRQFIHSQSPGSRGREKSFAGLVLIPDLMYPAGPIETVSTELWSDALNAKVLNTVATTQAFLRLICEYQSRVIVLTPTIIHSTGPPFHGVESAVVGALEGFISSLRGEMATLGARLCHIKMGTFDCSNFGEKQSLQRNTRADVLSWPSFARAAYAQNFSAQSEDMSRSSLVGVLQSRRNGSSLRTLNNVVFDSLTERHPWSVQRVGQGSLLYGIIGGLAPAALVNWMMGLKAVRLEHSLDTKSETDTQWEKLERAV